jgi:DNA-directed RNA polymerase specialized sigma24 family protein
MNHTERTATILVHLDALYNLARWLIPEATEAQALVRATLRQALGMAIEPHAGTKLRVRLLAIMWEIYGRQHATHPDGFGPDLTEPAPVARRTLLRTLSKADLDAALRQLPEALRATVVLCDMEGYALEEGAVILGWTRDRMQTALMQARRLLSYVLQARLASTEKWPAAEGEDSR